MPLSALERASRRLLISVGLTALILAANHSTVAAAPSWDQRGAVSATPSGPSLRSMVEGVFSSETGPSDTSNAMGTQRFIQTVNGKVGIFSTALQAVSSFPLWELAGVAQQSEIGDPQIQWDPGTHRFYYATYCRGLACPTPLLMFGFSRTPSPNGPSDFLSLLSGYGGLPRPA